MLSFDEFLTEQTLLEKLITFGGKAYPKFGNVVILAGGAGCFESSTLVKTQEGVKQISQIVPGDLVLTINEETNVNEYKPVLELKEHFAQSKNLVRVHLEDGTSFVCTDDHEFLINGTWVKAIDLELLKVERIENNLDIIYDLHVQDNHNYVLSCGLVAHNSGKGFQLEKLLGIEGKVLDVDQLKTLAQKSKDFAKRVKDEMGVDIAKLDLRIPENVSKLHLLVGKHYNLPDNREKFLFADILTKPSDRKPNIIFDVTLKEISKLKEISEMCVRAGYDKKNIHLVWILNNIDVAVNQNAGRSRVVPEDILFKTHEGAAKAMSEIISMGDGIKQYLDGDIYISFNQAKVDVELDVSKNDVKTFKDLDFHKDKKKVPGSYIKNADYIKIKHAGKSSTSMDNIGAEVLEKIKKYIPKEAKFG